MREFLNTDSEQSPLRPIEELRAAIDAITDGNPGELLTDQLEERFIAAVAAVAAKYNKSPEEMEHLINTIRLEDR
ncbi:MAG: hypothetical protein WBP22_02825 [Candidatus Saccharimonas sp.]